MNWLEEHLEMFVRPHAGLIPKVTKTSHAPYFSPMEMSVMKNAWRSLKAEARRLGLPILLTGRDMFLFYVLARRENYEHVVYRPDIARPTVGYVKQNYTNFVCLDTGFSGSIPTKLGCKAWFLLSSSRAGGTAVYHAVGYTRQMYAKNEYKSTPVYDVQPITTELHQMIPRNRVVRVLASRLEGTPKYWHSGQYANPMEVASWSNAKLEKLRRDNWDSASGITQRVADPRSVLAAAILTIQVYTDTSPLFATLTPEALKTAQPPRPEWAVNAVVV